MLIESRDSIEQCSQAVLELNREADILRVYGKVDSVRSAKLMIDMMLSKSEVDSSLNVRTRKDNGDGNDESNDVSARTAENTLQSEPEVQTLQELTDGEDIGCCRENVRTLVSEDDSSLQTDSEPVTCHSFVHVGFSDNFLKRGCDSVPTRDLDDVSDLTVDTEVLKDELCTQSDAQLIDTQLTHLSLSSPHTELKSSSDEEVERLHSVVEYDGKVEFALKLGYTENQLTTVINKLGHEASQNEILSELIKLGKCGIPDDESRLDSLECDSGLKITESHTRTAPLSPHHSSPDHLGRELEFVDKFRPVVIDGSNVAMSHGNKEVFSCRGIELAVEWFRMRGHTEITVFVPQWRKETSRPDSKIRDQNILMHLEKEKVLVFTPARRIGGKRVVCYDDRYILKLAAETGGIVVSNDNYRDLLNENPEYKKVVEERLLMYSFVNDRFMPPDDPLGRHGPSLDNFLSREPTVPVSLPPVCPYGSKKCTYGNKCKFYHPERGNLPQKTVTETLAEQTKQKMQDLMERGSKSGEGDKKKVPVRKQPLKPKLSLQRTQSLVPMEPLANRPPPDFSDLAADNPPPPKSEQTIQSSEKTEKWKSYDDKLTGFRKKMEQAEQEEKQRQEEGASSDAETSSLKMLPTSESLHTPLSTSDHISSRSSSPLQRSSPTQPIKPQEQFLSGHLLLAKKLSDEAADKKVRQKVSEERDHTRTPPTDLQQSRTALHRCNSPLAQFSQPQMQNQTLSHQMLSPEQQPQPRHQKLSRQLSLQGANDPRTHRSLQQQLSYDPRYSSQQTYQRRPQPIPGRQQGFYDLRGSENFGNVSVGAVDSGMRHTMQNIQQDTRACNEPFFSGSSGRHLNVEHATLARMQSAPEVPQLRSAAAAPPIARMVRQNSNSDTQLHIIGGEMEQTDYNFSEFQGGRSDYQQGDGFSSSYVPRGPGFEVHHQPVAHQFNRGFTHGVPSYPHSQGYTQPQKHHAGNTTWSFSDQGFAPGQIKQPAQFPGFHRHAPIQHSRSYQMMQSRPSQPNESYTERDPNFHTGILTKREDDIWGPSVASTSSSSVFSQNYAQGDNRYGDIPRSRSGMASPVSEQNRGHVGQSNTSSNSHTRSTVETPSAPSPLIAEDAPIHRNDSRYSLYYHLCGLFPEQKVRTVMNEHPDQTDPQELCAYIIGAK
ncbi:probable ribonuclease ZC3H12C isoform X2 [Pecten maximus]|nr:probable ribonuclease ZC3H12C isoform X2 [Pecten maximus]XP_033740921.1 probable ribonuclease ZC3H12C isoform X2 [Pecten maximus]